MGVVVGTSILLDMKLLVQISTLVVACVASNAPYAPPAPYAPAPYHAPAPYVPAPAPYHAPAPAPYHAPVLAPAPYHAPVIAHAPAPYHAPVIAHAPAPYHEEVPKNYQFGYDVHGYDEYGNANVHSRTESRDGYNVKGQYRVELPDCRTQIVDYYVDEYKQYHADVKYEGEVCPDKSLIKHAKHAAPYHAPVPAPYVSPVLAPSYARAHQAPPAPY